MDIGDFSEGEVDYKPQNRPPALPSDLPTSLDDRRHVHVDLVPETEMYDGWQGAFGYRRIMMLGSHIC